MTYYQVLGVEPTATQAELKRAFRTKTLEMHPDKFTHLSQAQQEEVSARFQEVVEAYQTLKDTQKRAIYDVTLQWQQFRWKVTTEDKAAVVALLAFLSLCITVGWYIHVVITYYCYTLLFRYKFLWKYAAIIIFACFINTLPAGFFSSN